MSSIDIARRTDVPAVYLSTDVRLYREGLLGSLSRHPGIEVLGAGTCADALRAVEALRPDVVLLDLNSRDSLSVARRVSPLVLQSRIVALGVTESEADVVACAEAGICGYVTKDASVEDLVRAVGRAMHGELVCSARIAATLFRRVAALSSGHEDRPAGPPLTAREHEIARMVARGMANKDVARGLGLGVTTIKNHVHTILQKLSVRRRGEIAVVLAAAGGDYFSGDIGRPVPDSYRTSRTPPSTGIGVPAPRAGFADR